MLTKTQFDILCRLLPEGHGKITQRELAAALGCSLGKVNETLRALADAGLMDEALTVTAAGREALAPYEVKNAVIMAAGMSTRFVPLSYEKPKALLTVKGEVLIEREIRQLREAGITDITVVVGYLKEQLFYLEDKYGVDIVSNEDYYRYNNTSTLIRVADRLDNTYVCSSDNYFLHNPFEKYVYHGYYAAVYMPGKTEEYCLTCDKKGRIVKVDIGGRAAWVMMGHAYFDRAFSRRFADILRDSYDDPQTRQQLWENLYMRHLKELSLHIRRYGPGEILEFDSLDELRHFDDRYLKNADSHIFSNICSVLKVEEDEITGIVPIKKGLTNSSFRFTARGKQYVYRHPGSGTDNFINRASEERSLQIARELGLDHTFIYMDKDEGWKISHYVDDARMLDYHDPAQVEQALGMIRTLHRCGRDTGCVYDLWEEIRRFEQRLKARGRNEFADMAVLHNGIEWLRARVLQEDREMCLCHCDAYDSNFLVDPSGGMNLIDWEYSGMAYRGGDIGTFIACSDYTPEQADRIIDVYLGHLADSREKRYYYAYICAAAYYWFAWAIYQNSLGNDVGGYLYMWYRCTKTYMKKAADLFEAADGGDGNAG